MHVVNINPLLVSIMERMRHDESKTPSVGTEIGVRLDTPPAIVKSVVGFNQAYDAWIVKAEYMGKLFTMPVFYWKDCYGWSERISN